MSVVGRSMPPARWECVRSGTSRTLLLRRSPGVHCIKHIEPLFQPCHAKVLIFYQVPHVEDEVDVARVDHRWLLHVCALLLIPRCFFGGLGRYFFLYVAGTVRSFYVVVALSARTSCHLLSFKQTKCRAGVPILRNRE